MKAKSLGVSGRIGKGNCVGLKILPAGSGFELEAAAGNAVL
jgi:hypothetical protein